MKTEFKWSECRDPAEPNSKWEIFTRPPSSSVPPFHWRLVHAPQANKWVLCLFTVNSAGGRGWVSMAVYDTDVQAKFLAEKVFHFLRHNYIPQIQQVLETVDGKSH